MANWKQGQVMELCSSALSLHAPHRPQPMESSLLLSPLLGYSCCNEQGNSSPLLLIFANWASGVTSSFIPTLKAHPILQAYEAMLKQWWQMDMVWALLGTTGSEGWWAGCPSPCGLASSPCALPVVCKHQEQVVLPHKLSASRSPGSRSLRCTREPSGTAGHTSRSAWRQVPAGTGCRTGSGGSPARSAAPWLSVNGKRWHTEPSNVYACWQGVSIYALCCGATQISAVQVVVRLLLSSIIIGSYK